MSQDAVYNPEPLMSKTLQRLDSLPITALHALVVMACAVSLGLDTMEISLGNAFSALFASPPYRMEPAYLSWLLSAVYVGAAIGAPLLGLAADRWGLRRTLTATLLWLGITTLITTIAHVNALMTWRFLSGLSLGALPPLLIAYLTGIAPTRYRGMFVFWVCAVAYIAPPITLFTIRWLTPLHPLGVAGWRWPLGIAGGMALGTAAVFLRLPESPRWLLAARRPTAEFEAASQRFEQSKPIWGRPDTDSVTTSTPPAKLSAPLSSPKSLWPRFAFIVVAFFLYPWAAVGFPLLTGPMLIHRGFDLGRALLYVAMTSVGPALGALVAGTFIDRVERRTALVILATLMLSSLALFFSAMSAQWLMMSVVSFGIVTGLYVPVLTTYAAEIVPSSVRSSVTSAAWAVDRIASFIAPIVLLPVLEQDGPRAVSMVLYAALLGSIAVVLSFGPPGAAGRVLQ